MSDSDHQNLPMRNTSECLDTFMTTFEHKVDGYGYWTVCCHGKNKDVE